MKMYALIFMVLTVLTASMGFGSAYNPHGSTGCHTGSSWDESQSRSDGNCWRFCSGSTGPWCYTAKNCGENKCYKQNTCSGKNCLPGDNTGCVQQCSGPDPVDCGIKSNGKVETVFTCEHYQAVLKCTVPGETISIISANYGRTQSGDRMCPNPNTRDLNCISKGSKNTVIAKCEGKPDCAVKASNSVFGDPCVGTYKYLEIQYSCIQSSQTTVNFA